LRGSKSSQGSSLPQNTIFQPGCPPAPGALWCRRNDIKVPSLFEVAAGHLIKLKGFAN
jgi:hypothetical protein